MRATAVTEADLGGFSREELLGIYQRVRTVAVVGASDSPDKAAHRIPAYLQSQGYRIIPVNPRGGTILGQPVRLSLAEIGEAVDLVDVFRPPSEAEAVARAAIEIGAKFLWFQPGTHTDAAVELARNAGLTVVFGICMGAVHGALGLGPGPE
jgi:predicted CoA-binding protein